MIFARLEATGDERARCAWVSERSFAAYLISRKMGGRLMARDPPTGWVPRSRPDTKLIGHCGVRFDRVAKIAAKMGAQT